MITKRQSGAALLAPFLFFVGPVHAHHSDYLLDASATLELRGTVVELELKSPHSTLVMDGAVDHGGSGHGEIARWEIETLPLGPMLRTLGIRRDTFKPGDVITVVARPHRDSRVKFARALVLVAADGTEFRLSSVDQLMP